MNVAEMRTVPPGHATTRFKVIEYSDWIDETMATKRTCTLGDWSWLWEWRFKGRDALKIIGEFTVNSLAKFDILQSKHAIHTDADGKLIAEGILTRQGEDEFVIFGRGGFWLDYMRRQGKYDVTAEVIDLYNLQVAGPNALALLEAASGTSLRDVKFMHSGELTIAGHKLYALRQGMFTEPGFELQGPMEHFDVIVAELLRVGKKFGLRRLGGRSSNIGHLEACFPTVFIDYCPAIFSDKMTAFRGEYLGSLPDFASTFCFTGSYEGKTIDDFYRSPVEMNWIKNIKFDHDFLGRAALEKEVASPRRLMRTLRWNSEDIVDVYASLFRRDTPYHYMELPRSPRYGMVADKVMKNGREVGVTTSRGYSYFCREMLSLVAIEPVHAEIGTEVTVVWGEPNEPQKEIRATVAPAPYLDNRRADLHKF